MVTPKQELLGWERELLGAYMSDHPFKQASVELAPYLTAQLAELGPDLAGAEAVVAGTVGAIRRLSTRQGKTFAAFAIEDLSGTAELTVWPDGYERFRELLVEGNVIVARIGVRQRADRLTLAVEDLCGFDLDAGIPIGFDPARFRVKAPRRRAPEPALAAGDSSAPFGDPPNAFDDAPALEGGTNARGHLRLVSSAASAPADLSPARPGIPIEERTGPRRLRIEMEETTDEAADRRRIRKIVAVLASAPGDAPVELTIRARGGSAHQLRLGTASINEDVIRQAQGLLGVLGSVREIGDAAYGLDVAVAAGG
jgi:hypothetical protein